MHPPSILITKLGLANAKNYIRKWEILLKKIVLYMCAHNHLPFLKHVILRCLTYMTTTFHSQTSYCCIDLLEWESFFCSLHATIHMMLVQVRYQVRSIPPYYWDLSTLFVCFTNYSLTNSHVLSLPKICPRWSFTPKFLPWHVQPESLSLRCGNIIPWTIKTSSLFQQNN